MKKIKAEKILRKNLGTCYDRAKLVELNSAKKRAARKPALKLEKLEQRVKNEVMADRKDGQPEQQRESKENGNPLKMGPRRLRGLNEVM